MRARRALPDARPAHPAPPARDVLPARGTSVAERRVRDDGPAASRVAHRRHGDELPRVGAREVDQLERVDVARAGRRLEDAGTPWATRRRSTRSPRRRRSRRRPAPLRHRCSRPPRGRCRRPPAAWPRPPARTRWCPAPGARRARARPAAAAAPDARARRGGRRRRRGATRPRPPAAQRRRGRTRPGRARRRRRRCVSPSTRKPARRNTPSAGASSWLPPAEQHRRAQRAEHAQEQPRLLCGAGVREVSGEQHTVHRHPSAGGEPCRGARTEDVVVDVAGQQQPHDVGARRAARLRGQLGGHGLEPVQVVLKTAEAVALVAAGAQRAQERQHRRDA